MGKTRGRHAACAQKESLRGSISLDFSESGIMLTEIHRNDILAERNEVKMKHIRLTVIAFAFLVIMPSIAHAQGAGSEWDILN